MDNNRLSTILLTIFFTFFVCYITWITFKEEGKVEVSIFEILRLSIDATKNG